MELKSGGGWESVTEKKIFQQLKINIDMNMNGGGWESDTEKVVLLFNVIIIRVGGEWGCLSEKSGIIVLNSMTREIPSLVLFILSYECFKSEKEIAACKTRLHNP